MTNGPELSHPTSENKIRVADLDSFEWLVLEAMWSNTKTPFNEQWHRIKTHPDVTDPAGVAGLVIGGNLQRALLAIKNADDFGHSDHDLADALNSQAAVHLGKMAGGLLGLTVMLDVPYGKWHEPISNLLPEYSLIANRVMADAQQDGTTSLDANFYYQHLSPIQSAIALSDDTEGSGMSRLSKDVESLTKVAARTWLTFLSEHADLAIDQGATPRSTGQYIEDLRTQFDPIVTLVHDEAVRRQPQLP